MHSLYHRIALGALGNFERYVVIASIVYIFSIVMTFSLNRVRLQPTVVHTWRQLAREWAFSLITTAIFASIILIALATHFVVLQPRGSMSVISQTFIVGVLIVLHDTWFYWTHRLMHMRPFWPIHRLHHLSIAPTVWSAYAFHPVEALINGIFITAMSPFLPLSFGIITGFMVFMLARNALGHCGREVFPSGDHGQPLMWWSTTVTHHDMHHQWGKGNYGLYFTFWDRMMRTEHPAYLQQFRDAVKTSAAAGEKLSRVNA